MTQRIFRIHIASTWSASEMAELFKSAEIIYTQFTRFHSSELYRKIAQQQNQPETSGNSDGKGSLLMVRRVSFSSPGWIDLAGLGEVIGHVKDLILGLTDRIIERQDREQERQLTAASIEAAMLDNYSKQLDLIDQTMNLVNRNDLNDATRSQILTQIMQAQRPIANGVAAGRILSVEALKNDGD